MAGRDPRPRGRRGAVVLAVVLAGAIAPPASHAQPAPGGGDIARAKELYLSAEAAMKDGRFDDAARDYGAAYELSKDPALFYKIGRANERAGRCQIAVIYYARYLHEGKPAEQFTALTRERIAGCGGSTPGSGEGAPAAMPPHGADTGSAAPVSPGGGPLAGSGGAAVGGAGSTGSHAVASDSPTRAPAPAGENAAPSEGGARTSGGGTVPPALLPNPRQKVAWLMSGGAIALVTLGGVLAYATGSSENDVRDLYAGLGGQVPAFNAQTQMRYDDLVDEGRRYQHLSWAAFGLAGAAAAGAAILFTAGRGEEPARHAQRGPAIAPVITTRGAGVAVRF